jgi:sugar/nucleoside kinase (ribokinase family)
VSTGQSAGPIAFPHVTDQPTLDVVTIGHAIVDVLGYSDDEFLERHGLAKGIMELVDGARAVPLYEDMANRADLHGEHLLQLSGGSSANTAVVAAVMGAKAGFIGKVRDDALGHAFTHDIREAGVHFSTPHSDISADPTGRCLINVTPDAERTMCTYLGAARGLRVPDMDESLLGGARVTYLEGYLWDEMQARAALERAIAVVHREGRRFSLTLSDPFCVDRFRDEWVELVNTSVDILFGNDAELLSLFQTDDLDDALERVGELCEVAAITRGAKGSIVVSADGIEEVPAHHVAHVVDTTGAGDAYAGGFLFGFTRGDPLARCAELGGLAAAEVISHLGARPTEKLSHMVASLT